MNGKRRLLARLLRRLFSRPPRDARPAPAAPEIGAMVRGILATRDEEIDCAECFEQLDRFVEEVVAGRNPREALPLVQHHLDHCPDCREEFEALLEALRGLGDG